MSRKNPGLIFPYSSNLARLSLVLGVSQLSGGGAVPKPVGGRWMKVRHPASTSPVVYQPATSAGALRTGAAASAASVADPGRAISAALASRNASRPNELFWPRTFISRPPLHLAAQSPDARSRHAPSAGSARRTDCSSREFV